MTTRSFSRRVLLAASLAAATLTPSRISAQNWSAASDRAFAIARLESRRKYSALYDLMHPDAQAIVPREVVIGWYIDYLPGFDVLGELTSVDNIDFIDWTWAVTGVTYPNTAEVSFTQTVTRGGVASEFSDIVRLVPVDDVDYRWFFGRSADFVNEQIALHGRSAGTGEFTLHRLGVLPGLDLSGGDVINNAGVVAGDSSPFGDPGDRGFIYRDGEMLAMDELLGLDHWVNYPRAINESGSIVGGTAPFEGTFKPYLIEGDAYRELPRMEDRNHAIAMGINDAGLIVGDAFGFSFGTGGTVPNQAVWWPTIDTIEPIPTPNSVSSRATGVNDNDWVIGTVELSNEPGKRPVIWRRDPDWQVEFLPMIPFANALDATPLDINNENVIVGTARIDPNQPGGEPWVWRPGDAELTPLPVPPGVEYIHELAINGSDVIVGTARTESSNIGLIWRGGEVSELTQLLDTGSFVVTEANDIAESGEIAGQVVAYGDPRSRMAAIITAV